MELITALIQHPAVFSFRGVGRWVGLQVARLRLTASNLRISFGAHPAMAPAAACISTLPQSNAYLPCYPTTFNLHRQRVTLITRISTPKTARLCGAAPCLVIPSAR